MKYIKEYLETVVKVKPLGELTTSDEQELNGLSGEMVYIDGKCSDIFISHADYANWLESKDEQKPFNYECASFQQKDFAPKEEPRFNIGDWIVSDLEDVNEDFRLCKIIGIEDGCYVIQSANGCKGYNFFETWESDYHLWSIEDTKPGDVLADDYGIYIFDRFNEHDERCFLCMGVYQYSQKVFENEHMLCSVEVHPATKEQCDLLSQKMKESGYEWNDENKELKNIEEKSTWNEEDEVKDNWEYIQDFIKKLGRFPKDSDELDVLINYVLGKKQKSATWGEEDEETMSELLSFLLINTPEQWAKYGKWLKSLKERHTWKPSSELDEASYQVGVKRVLENPKSYGLTKYNWKPSDEQIKAIRLARSFVTDDFDEHPALSEILIELEKQLKKLREE